MCQSHLVPWPSWICTNFKKKLPSHRFIFICLDLREGRRSRRGWGGSLPPPPSHFSGGIFLVLVCGTQAMKSKEEEKKRKKVRFTTDYHRWSWITCGASRRLARGNRTKHAFVRCATFFLSLFFTWRCLQMQLPPLFPSPFLVLPTISWKEFFFRISPSMSVTYWLGIRFDRIVSYALHTMVIPSSCAVNVCVQASYIHRD